MSSQTLCATPLRQHLIQLRRDLGISWRHMPIRLGIDRKELEAIRFADRVEAPIAVAITNRIGVEPSALWPEVA